ncbi:response regulator [Paenibacillus sp. FSL H8-0537]|uniref:response regulator transcription factor n=1 Tax=Paenibacillus sp. FSL H8-0537 TaxID=2921399 RepID=UPI003101AC66
MDIVVVDDEERIRLGLCKLIEQAGEEYRIIGAYGSGQELLDQLDHIHPDFVLTDIKMPQMTGLQLIAKVKRLGKNIKFAVLSGFNDFEYARESLRQGAEDYLLKPVNLEELIRLLAKVNSKVKQERSRSRLESGDLISLLLYADEKQLPSYVVEDVCGTIDQLPLFLHHYAVLLLTTAPELNEIQLERFMADWLRERIIITGEGGKRVILISIHDSDHAETVRELSVTLLQRLPAFTRAKIGFSSIFRGSSWLTHAYSEAFSAYQHAWYNPEPRWSSGAVSRVAPVDHLLRLTHIVSKELLPALQMNDFALAQAKFEGWLQEAAAQRICWKELQEACFGISAHIAEELKKRSVQLEYGQVNMPIDPEASENWEAFAQGLRAGMEEISALLGSTRSDNRAIDKVKSYIQQHFTEELELQRLADIVYLTPSYLSKLFKTETGETITDYMISVRIEAAKQLLRQEQGLKTYMVGERVGYADPAYFTKVFKKMAGLTPKEYRDKVR